MPADSDLNMDEHDVSLLSGMVDNHEAAAASMPNIAEVPKIRVVVRSRPLNAKEVEKGDDDIISVSPDQGQVVVDKERARVDLVKFKEEHRFVFDDALDGTVDNDTVYCFTVQPLIQTIFRQGKSTCFAYGQTGSGKTYTMAPLPPRAAREILALLGSQYPDLYLAFSCFEIYGNKVYDLLNDKNQLNVREDAKKRVNVVNLAEKLIQDSAEVETLIKQAANVRATGQTGANAESSRSHCIIQFSLRRRKDKAEMGRLSFIDLAGSERGADNSFNDKQIRLEGAEINTSLLTLKECIRALDGGANHVPFRGSKLTEVLRDSFVGKEARTVMIANISPSASSVEHTLNTLRYADRVKELRKDKNQRAPGGVTPGANNAAYNAAAMRGAAERAAVAAAPAPALQPPAQASAVGGRQPFSQREVNNSQTGSERMPAGGGAAPQAAAPAPSTSAAPQGRYANGSPYSDTENGTGRQQLMDDSEYDDEDNLINAHRREIEISMGAVRREMGLLSQVDQPDAAIETYVDALRELLVEKQQAIKNLLEKLDSFSHKRSSRPAPPPQHRVGSGR